MFNHQFIAINGKRIPLKNAKIFKGEIPDTDSSIIGDYLFLAKNHICIEAIYPSASGSSVRHKSIYLIDTKKIAANKMTLYKLPSLFGSCLGVRFSNKDEIYLDKVSYLYDSGDQPSGVVFEENKIKMGKFVSSNKKVTAKFLDTENVYRFEIHSNTSISNDISELRQSININLPIEESTWEIFGTPEDTRGVPGPTDYTTLVAEFKIKNTDFFNALQSSSSKVGIVPEAARPWLSESFRMMLDKHKNSALDVNKLPFCKPYSTSVKESGRLVNGFVCVNDNHLMLYLPL